ncbi:MAG: hypothetical protein K2P51_02605 [Rhabdochlamydiaceae bacterium]|nr:hypothetical protein [Rhabdochlamydiaceae bacterium]
MTTQATMSSPSFRTPLSEPFSQHIQCASDTEKSQAAFYRVRIQKLDEKGAVRFFNVKDPSTNEVTGTKSEFSSIVDRATGDLYYDEEAYAIWGKCVALTVGIPLYAAASIGWHLIRTPVVVKLTLFNALWQWPFANENMRAKIKEDLTQIPIEMTAGVCSIVKAPFYAIAMQASAFVGLVHPYLGRKWVAAVEHAWHDKISIKQSFVTLPERPNENCCISCIKDTALNKPFYLAGCFQVRGNLSDKRIRVL